LRRLIKNIGDRAVSTSFSPRCCHGMDVSAIIYISSRDERYQRARTGVEEDAEHKIFIRDWW